MADSYEARAKSYAIECISLLKTEYSDDDLEDMLYSIEGMRVFLQFMKSERELSPSERYKKFEDILKAAQKLQSLIEGLPITYHQFLYNKSKTFFIEEEGEDPLWEILDDLQETCQLIMKSKKPRSSRPKNLNNNEIVQQACILFLKYGNSKLSGTPTGKFAEFARTFYHAVTREWPKDTKLESTIREVAKSPENAKDYVALFERQMAGEN